MGGMGQPEHGLHVELVDALAADAQGAADGGKGAGWGVMEAVVGDDDVS
jgi:hypothetical protein